MTTSTTSAASSAVTMPSTNVAAVASENDWWIPPTIAGINGSTNALELIRHLRQDRRSQVAATWRDVVQEVAPAGGN